MTRRRYTTPAEAEAQGLLCKTAWKAHGLMPAPDARPADAVWQGQGWYAVYRRDQCVPYRYTPGPTEQRRRACTARARDWIADGLMVDTETTGLGPDAEIIEIAVIDGQGNALLDTLVRSTRSIPAYATEIHGLRDADVADAPSWPEVHSRLAVLAADQPLLAYNAPFDDRLLDQTSARHGLPHPAPSTYDHCVMRLWRDWVNADYWWKLDDAARFCGRSVGQAHRALSDARMALGVLQYIARHPRRRH